MKRPIAAQLRRKQGKRSKKDNPVLVTSLEEQIAALEKELAEGSGSGSDDDSDSDTPYDSSSGDTICKAENSGKPILQEQNAVMAVLDEEGNVISFKSTLEGISYYPLLSPSSTNLISIDERIQGLPRHYLPDPKCGVPKKDNNGNIKTKKPKKKKSNNDTSEPATSSGTVVNSGLEKTVTELLRHYVPASLEKRAFYCRVCRFTGTCLEDLDAHKASQLHALATQKERKMSFCKLCRKQFTSPDQLKGHLKGRPHMERLEKLRGMPRKQGHFERY